MSQSPIRLELPTGFDFGTVNAYLFPEPEPVLVDTGLKSAASWAALEAGLARYGLSAANLARVVITHPHVDHCGQARQIVEAGRAEVWINAPGRPWLLDLPGLMQDRVDYYREVYLPCWGLPPAIERRLVAELAGLADVTEAVPAARVQIFHPGDTLEMGGLDWQVLPAPGHAPSQTCFYQPQTRQLLSADMLLARTPAPVLDRPGGSDPLLPAGPPLAQFLDSLARLDSLDVERVYPGHGQPFDHHRQVIAGQRERLAARRAECLAHITAGHRTVAALMDRMYSLEPGGFRLVGLWMLVGYVQLLQAEGLVKEELVNGVAHYRPAAGT